MSDNQDFWRHVEETTEEEMQRWNEAVQRYLELVGGSYTYWDSYDSYLDDYDSIWDPLISMFVIRYIFLLIRQESQKEREWFENLKKNLKRFLP
uniref:Uncharacterized protein n=1 Tax=Thermofilum adornatum TaxID=1365176 RepID=A0A7C1CDB9_9CREN